MYISHPSFHTDFAHKIVSSRFSPITSELLTDMSELLPYFKTDEKVGFFKGVVKIATFLLDLPRKNEKMVDLIIVPVDLLPIRGVGLHLYQLLLNIKHISINVKYLNSQRYTELLKMGGNYSTLYLFYILLYIKVIYIKRINNIITTSTHIRMDIRGFMLYRGKSSISEVIRKKFGSLGSNSEVIRSNPQGGVGIAVMV